MDCTVEPRSSNARRGKAESALIQGASRCSTQALSLEIKLTSPFQKFVSFESNLKFHIFLTALRHVIFVRS